MQINNNGTRTLYYWIWDNNQYGSPLVMDAHQLNSGSNGSIVWINQDGEGYFNFRYEIREQGGDVVAGDTVRTNNGGYTVNVW